MTKIKISLIAAMLTATAILFTCEKIPDYCGDGEIYDPGCEFCFGSRAYPLCSGGADYNPLTGGCDKNNRVGTRCSDETVVPSGPPCGGYTLAIAATPEIGGTLETHTLPNGPTYAANQEIELIATSANNEYKFAGWAGAQPSKTEAVSDVMTKAVYKMTGGMPQVTIVAMFRLVGKGKLMTDAFPKLSGAVSCSPLPDPNTGRYKEGTEVTVTATPKEGYTFAGWSGAGVAEPSKNPAKVLVDSSITLVAMFASVVHTLKTTVNPADGGAIYINGTAQTGNVPQGVGTDIEVLAREAERYRFVGWTGTSATFGNDKSLSTRVTLKADASITAHFELGNSIGSGAPQAVTCTLTVNGNPADGGSVTHWPDLSAYTVGAKVTATAAPKEGYTFTGWSGASESQETTVTITTTGGKMTLTANFRLNPKSGQFMVTFDANGGTFSGAAQTSYLTNTNGLLESLPPDPARSGYMFSGWYTAADGGDKVATSKKYNQNATVYAHWDKNVTGGGDSTYEFVTIGGKKWMKKNLNIETADSWCYLDSPDNCRKYGRLYTWSVAKSACQFVVMRLPTRKEWDDLSDLAGTGQKVVSWTSGNDTGYYWPGAGTKLKSTSGWNNNGNGTDDFKFSALPGGGRISGGNFYGAGGNGNWWTATEYGSYDAYYRRMYYYDDGVDVTYVHKDVAFSVRCLADD